MNCRSCLCLRGGFPCAAERTMSCYRVCPPSPPTCSSKHLTYRELFQNGPTGRRLLQNGVCGGNGGGDRSFAAISKLSSHQGATRNTRSLLAFSWRLTRTLSTRQGFSWSFACVFKFLGAMAADTLRCSAVVTCTRRAKSFILSCCSRGLALCLW